MEAKKFNHGEHGGHRGVGGCTNRTAQSNPTATRSAFPNFKTLSSVVSVSSVVEKLS